MLIHTKYLLSRETIHPASCLIDVQVFQQAVGQSPSYSGRLQTSKHYTPTEPHHTPIQRPKLNTQIRFSIK